MIEPGKRTQSRFAFAQDSAENNPAAANMKPGLVLAPTPTSSFSSRERRTGIVSRVVGEQPTPKYGFIQTSEGGNIFFHFKTLSVDVMACIERGSEVEFHVEPNPFSSNKPMAIDVKIKDNRNKYANSEGILSKWLPDKGFGFITAACGTVYFAHQRSFSKDAATVAATDSFRKEFDSKVFHVKFDKSVNYKSSPPKPFALNIRVEKVSEKPALQSSPGAWCPSPRTLKNRSQSRDSLQSSPQSPRRGSFGRGSSFRNSVKGSEANWRASSNAPRSALFQNYDVNHATVSHRTSAWTAAAC
jgi:cold shock CspA family protein